MIGCALICAAAVLALGCGSRVAIPPPPTDVREIVVTTVNQTGSELIVGGDWYLERLMGERRASALDVLVSEATAILAERGFTVRPATDRSAPSLLFAVRRFDAAMPPTELVTVDIVATVTSASGTVIWRASRERWMVPTRGVPSVAAAWTMAARAVARTFLDGWRIAPP